MAADTPAVDTAIPGTVWSAALLLAPLAGAVHSTGTTTAGAWAWGVGAVALILVFPWLLVRTLDRRGDLRLYVSRAQATPVIVGAGALCFILLRLILWLNGPRELAAVVFAMIVSFTLTLVLPQRLRPDWPALSLGAGVVILPALLMATFPSPLAGVAAAAAGVAGFAVLLFVGRAPGPRRFISAGLGAFIGGGLFLLLESAAG